MSSNETSSRSESTSDSEPSYSRQAGNSISRQSTSSTSAYPVYRTRPVSDESERWAGQSLTGHQLSSVSSQTNEQTIHERLREDARTLERVGSDTSAELRRQSIIAMDRKRRLTSSGHDGGRRRNNSGNGYHERGSSGHVRRHDGPSSPPRQSRPNRADSSGQLAEVIDLTSSSPVTSNRPLPPTPLQGLGSEGSRLRISSRGSSRSSRRYNVPKWQPDAEVTECPVCKRAFGFLFRRHHCRKCGRVVCNECSPHRITLPRSMIVYPPGPDRSLPPIRSGSHQPIDTVDLTRDDDDTGNRSRALAAQLNRSELEGGEKVRLCNPCVPDPQPSPDDCTLPPLVPQLQPQRMADSSSHTAHVLPATFSHSQLSRSLPRHRARDADGPRTSAHRHHHSSAEPPRPQDPYIGSGSRGYGPPQPFHIPDHPFSPSHQSLPGASSSSYEDTFSRLRRMIGATNMPAPASASNLPPPQVPGHSRYQSLDLSSRPLPPTHRPHIRSILDVDHDFQRFRDHTLGSSSMERPPRPRLRESDICPVCRRPLPPRGADGDETAREAHIMDCISARDPAAAQSRAVRQDLTGQPHPPAALHMVSFVATEKDCLGEDGSVQECSICMVEYNVGDQLARLECLCRFHRECIMEWLGRKQECPLHKIA